MKCDRASRISKRSRSPGTSMIRPAIGSVSPPGNAARNHPATRVFGTVAVSTTLILLTHGTSQALELVIRYLLRPGDAALVDDPGYYNMFGNLRLHGIEMLAVPRNRDGPDIATLEKLAAAPRPKAYFTQPGMQTPT